MTKIVGLDLSLTSTGVAVVLGDFASTETIKPKAKGHARLSMLQAEIGNYVDGATLVVVEGPAFASAKGQQGHHERAGLWWLITHSLHRRSIPTAIVPPSTLKKYVTGKGNADKDTVLLAVARRYPTVDIHGNDEADALVLAAMGARHLDHPIDDMPSLHLEGMAKVEWPTGVLA